ncbi:hypothetical protein QO019_004049 [Streptomyces thermodiastaticus]|uniref:Uncharacterized protein n=1 Tax=Streptomyces thermodiastaticus TaxID=44061 RepID=A0ABU0KMG9_9ACTN|nr:hypothetical protein [Streptomyces thermodiastaticus]
MPVTPETGCACPAGRKSCGISARSALRHAVACGAFQRRVRGVGGWSRSSPRPFGAPPPSARRPTLAQRHPFNAGCGQSLADRAVPRAPSGCLRRRHAAPRWGSGTPSTPGAGRPCLIAQFPAPLQGASAVGTPPHAGAAAPLQRRVRAVPGWSRSSPRPFGRLRSRHTAPRWGSGTPATPGAGSPWLVAQFPAPLQGASAVGTPPHAGAAAPLQRLVRVVRGWSRSSPRPFGAPPPSARRPTLAQRHPFNAWCGSSVAGRAVPRAPSGRLRNCGQSCLPQCLKGLGGGRRRHLVGTEVRRCPRPVPTDGTSDHGVAHVADGGQK